MQTGEAPATAKTVVCISAGRRAALLAAIAGAWLAASAGVLTAQATTCLRNATLGASFSVSCAGMSCTFTNTSSPPPAGFSALEWDFGDGGFLQGPPSSTSPASHTYAAGTYLITLTLTGGDGQVAVATGSVMLGGQGIPLAADDAFTTPMNTPLVISIAELLSNDLPGVTFYQVSGCALSPAGDSCTYTPPPNQVGVYGFTYSVQDAIGNQGSANVFVTVTQPLVANPDYFSTFIGVPIQITSTQLLANDQPPPPHAVFVTAENPVNGTLKFVNVNAQGAAVYLFTPTLQSVGSASFDYLISLDGSPPYEMGFVYINIADHPPVAAFTVVQCVNRTCTVRSFATDDVGIVRWTWDFGDGTVVTSTTPADQTHTYAHSGLYNITLTVTDTSAQTNSLALSVLANTPPVAVDDTATTFRDLPVPIYVLANDSDPDGDPLSIASVNMQNYPGASWQVVPSGSSWALKVTPPDNFVGTMTFTYVAADQWGGTSTATVTLTVNQTAHVLNAADQQFWCQQNGSIRIPKASLLTVDYDSTPGVTLGIVGFDTSVLSGTLDCTTDSTACTFTPPANAYGVTLFRYTVAELPPAAGYQDTGTVRIYVGTYGHAPTANDVYFTTTRNTPKVFTIQDVVQNDFDPDGDSLSMALQSGPTAYGSLSCSTPMYTCTYTPNPGFVGTDRFLYSASDGINPPVTATINILTLPPMTPTFDAREDVIVTGVNQSASFTSGLLSNDYLPNGGPETVTALDTTGLIGTLSCNATSCTYTPPNSFSGATTFKYTANDGHGATDTAIVKIKVGVTNHPPVAVAQTLSTPKNTALRFSVFDLMKNDYDPDDDPLSVTVYTVTAHLGSLSCGTPNYWCTYTPNADATGADAITYLLSDGTASVTSTVTITITNTTPP